MSGQQTLFDDGGAEGRKRKDEGIERVLDHQGDEWKDRAQAMVLAYLRRFGPAPIEDARAWALSNGLGDPSHPNAWGAVSNALAKRQAIVMTGSWRKAKSAKSHASWYPVWRAVSDVSRGTSV